MKLIVTDLDNTLLRSDKSISPYTVQVLEACRAKGYCIAFATARAESAMARQIAAVKPEIIISNGGAIISVGGEIIYKNLISAETAAVIVRMCRQFTDNNGLITADCDDGYYCNFVPRDPDRRAAHTYSDFADFAVPAYKITAELECEAWAREICRVCPACTVINFTGENWRRFAAKNSDKATALQILVDYIGVELTDVIAFGDDWNDLGMLKLAGAAVAVSNAIDEVKAIADDVTDSHDDDGVAVWLEKTILKKEQGSVYEK